MQEHKQARHGTKRLISFVLVLSIVFSTLAGGVLSVSAESVSEPSGYLTQNGTPAAQIVLPEGATEMEKYAAEELRDHIELVSGARLPISITDLSRVDMASSVYPTEIKAETKGYYPFEISFSNPTDTAQTITMSQVNGTDGMPTALIRGEDGLADGQVNVAAGAQVVVHGLVKVEDATAFGKYVVEIEARTAENELLDTYEITVLAYGNLLGGSNFESGTTAWTGGSIDDATGYQDASYKASNPAYGKELSLNSGNLYLLKFWAKSNDTAAVNVRLRDYKSDGTALVTPMSLNNRMELSGLWTYYEFRFVANMSGDDAYAYSMLDFVGDGSSIWLDELSLLDCSEATDSVADNGDYESSSWDPWALDNRGYVDLVQSSDCWTGSYSAAVTISGTDDPDPAQVVSPGRYSGMMSRAKANTTYTLSFWAKASANQTAIINPQPWMGVDGATIYVDSSPTFELTTEWERYEFTFRTADTEVWGGLNVNMELDIPKAPNASQTTIYLDSVSIIATDSADERGGMIEKPVMDVGLVANGDFESFTEGAPWENVTVDNTTGYNDSTSYKADASAAPGYNHELSMVSGRLYLLGFWAKTDDASADVNVRVSDYDSAGAVLATPYSLNSKLTLTTEWTYYEFRFLANTGSSASYAYSKLDFTGTGNIWLDDVVLLDCGVSPDILTGAHDMEAADLIYIEGDAQPYQFVPYRFDNRNWNALEADATDYYTGAASAKLTIDAGYQEGHGNLHESNAMLVLADGKTYTFSFWAKDDGSQSTVNASFTEAQTNADETFTLTDEWQRYEMTFTMKNPREAWPTFNFKYAVPDTEGAVIHWDNFYVIETAAADTVKNESSQANLITNAPASCDNWENGTVTDDGRRGTAYMADASANPAYTGELSMISDRLYLLGFWAKTDESGADVDVRVSDFDSDGAALSVPASLNSKLALTTEWTYYEFRFLANTGNLDAYAYSKLDFTGTGNIWLDDVVLLDCGVSPTILTDAHDMEVADFVEGAQFEGDTQEGQFSPWRFDNRDWNVLSADTTTFYTGKASAKMDITSSGEGHGNTYPSEAIDQVLQAGKTYTLSFWAKQSENGGCVLRPVIDATDKSTDGDVTFALTTQWQRYEMTFTVDNPKSSPNYFNLRFTSTDTAADFWLDNFYMIETSAADAVKNAPTESEEEDPDTTPMPEQPEILAPMVNPFTIVLATPDSYPALVEKYADDLTYLQDSDGFAIRQDGDVIYIFGTETGGVLNGVYDFLEENLGIIWLRAEDTAYQPNDTVAVNKVNYREKSPFTIRGWHAAGDNVPREGYYTPSERLFARNKLNAIGVSNPTKGEDTPGLNPMNIGHNAHELILKSPLYDPNETEYWCTDEEGNLHEFWDDPFKTQINYWSTKASDAAAATLIQRVKESGNDYIFFGVEDGPYTTCLPYSNQPIVLENGTNVLPTDEDYISTAIFTFVNRVAKQMKQECPDVTLTTFAYWICQTPPRCEIEDNVCVVFAPIDENNKLPINTTEVDPGNNEAYANIEAWSKKTTNLAFYNYYGCYIVSGYYERPLAKRIQADLQYYAERGFTGLIPEGKPDVDLPVSTPWQEGDEVWSMNILTFWLYSKLAWNPYEDIDALTKQFCEAVYGDAADAMYQYYKLMEKGWDEGGNDPEDPDMLYTVKLPVYMEEFIVEPGLEDDIQTTLDTAWAAADDTAKSRIKYIKETFELNIRNYTKVEIEDGTALYTTAGKEKILSTFDFTDAVWADATPLVNFCNNSTGQFVAGLDTTVRLLWDENYLYVGYENFDNTITDLITTSEYSDTSNSWWNGVSDDVETFVTIHSDAGNGAEDSPYYAYFANPNGLNFRYGKIAGNTTHLAEAADWDTAVRIYDEGGDYNDRWVVIQAISFESLGLTGDASSETDLYAYFYRQYYHPDNTDTQISWNGAPVWTPTYLRKIELINDANSDADTTEAEIAMHSIILEGNIGVNYWTKLSDTILADESAYMKFQMPDGTVTQILVSEAKLQSYGGETYHTFRCEVAAKEMADDIEAQIIYTGGSSTVDTYCVKDYADGVLANALANESLKELMRAMLHYGGYAQQQFGYNTENLANSGLDTSDVVAVEASDLQAYAVESRGTDQAKLTATNLTLDSNTKLRFYFTLDSTVTNFSVLDSQGEQLTVTPSDNGHYVDVVSVAAQDLDEEYTVTIHDGSQSAEVKASALSYCYSVLHAGDLQSDTLENVVKALYLYNKAANQYFANRG